MALRTDGTRGLFRGTIPLLSREVPFYVVGMTGYAYLKNVFNGGSILLAPCPCNPELRLRRTTAEALCACCTDMLDCSCVRGTQCCSREAALHYAGSAFGGPGRDLKDWQVIAIGGLAGALASIATTPAGQYLLLLLPQRPLVSPLQSACQEKAVGDVSLLQQWVSRRRAVKVEN